MVTPKSDPVNVLLYIDQLLNCGHEQAIVRYRSIFREPSFVKLKILTHQTINGELVPFVEQHELHLLKPYVCCIEGEDEGKKETEEVEEEEETKNEIVGSVFKRQRTTRVEDKLHELTNNVNNLASVLGNISKLDVEDSAKDILRTMAVGAVIGENKLKALSPPILISRMVHEHLGYMPVKVDDGTMHVSELFKAIGRIVRLVYIQKYGAPPNKRTYSDGNTVKETNDYMPKDKVWISALVAEQCQKYQVFPRPTVSLSRGEEVHQFPT
jgi:hypothetical protein